MDVPLRGRQLPRLPQVRPALLSLLAMNKGRWAEGEICYSVRVTWRNRACAIIVALTGCSGLWPGPLIKGGPTTRVAALLDITHPAITPVGAGRVLAGRGARKVASNQRTAAFAERRMGSHGVISRGGREPQCWLLRLAGDHASFDYHQPCDAAPTPYSIR